MLNMKFKLWSFKKQFFISFNIHVNLIPELFFIQQIYATIQMYVAAFSTYFIMDYNKNILKCYFILCKFLNHFVFFLKTLIC